MPICVGRDLKGIRRRFCKLAAILGAEEAKSSDTVFLVPSAMICSKRQQGANTNQGELRAMLMYCNCHLPMGALKSHSTADRPKQASVFPYKGAGVSRKSTEESVKELVDSLVLSMPSRAHDQSKTPYTEAVLYDC